MLLLQWFFMISLWARFSSCDALPIVLGDLSSVESKKEWVCFFCLFTVMDGPRLDPRFGAERILWGVLAVLWCFLRCRSWPMSQWSTSHPKRYSASHLVFDVLFALLLSDKRWPA